MTSQKLSSPGLSSGRRRALRAVRSKLLQRLFADEYAQFDLMDPEMRVLLQWESEDPMAVAFVDRLYAEILFHKSEIDRTIELLAKGWSLDRLTRIDRNILRIGLCEILFIPDMPFRVSIHEALELAHQFSEPEAVSFINGILHEAGVRFAKDKGPFDPPPSSRHLSRAAEEINIPGEGSR